MWKCECGGWTLLRTACPECGRLIDRYWPDFSRERREARLLEKDRKLQEHLSRPVLSKHNRRLRAFLLLMTAIVAAVAIFEFDLKGIKVPFFHVNTPELQQIYRFLWAASILCLYAFFGLIVRDLKAWVNGVWRPMRATASEVAIERYVMYSILGAHLAVTVYAPPVLLFIVNEAFLAPMVR